MIFPAWQRLVELYERRIFRLLSHYRTISTPQFEAGAYRIAMEMVHETAVTNASSWRMAARRSSNGAKIYKALEEEIARGNLSPVLQQVARQNARRITSLPSFIATSISRHAAKMAAAGSRAGEIESEIRRLRPHLIESRVKLIARTEVSKAETDLTRARAQRLDIPAYVWETSNDERVRPSHRNMNGVIVLWTDTPAPESLIGEKSTLGQYDAGSAPNCRCLAMVLADLDEVKWPARVHRGGYILRMNRKQFTKYAGVPLAA